MVMKEHVAQCNSVFKCFTGMNKIYQALMNKLYLLVGDIYC